MSTTVSAQLPKELYEWVRRFERDTNLFRSEIIRLALIYYRASAGSDVILLESEIDKLKNRLAVLESH